MVSKEPKKLSKKQAIRNQLSILEDMGILPNKYKEYSHKHEQAYHTMLNILMALPYEEKEIEHSLHDLKMEYETVNQWIERYTTLTKKLGLEVKSNDKVVKKKTESIHS